MRLSQLTFICLKLTIATLGKRCEICSRLKPETPERRQWKKKLYVTFGKQWIKLFKIKICSAQTLAFASL